jgi:hypothetical protein
MVVPATPPLAPFLLTEVRSFLPALRSEIGALINFTIPSFLKTIAVHKSCSRLQMNTDIRKPAIMPCLSHLTLMVGVILWAYLA